MRKMSPDTERQTSDAYTTGLLSNKMCFQWLTDHESYMNRYSLGVRPQILIRPEVYWLADCW